MQQFEFDGVGEEAGQLIGCARSGIDRGELGSITLKFPRDGSVAGRLPADVKRRAISK